MEPTTVKDRDGRGFTFAPIVCPTCKVDDTRFLGLRGGKYHRYGQGIESRIVQCRHCDLLYPNPFPRPVDAQELYGDPEEYFASYNGDAKVNAYRSLVQEASRMLGRLPESALDVGCGKGEFLQAAKKEGIRRVVGLELSRAAAAIATAECDAQVEVLTIEEFVSTVSERFDLVTLCAVLEHVYNPDSAIEAIARVMKPGGLLYIDVPNEPNLVTRVFGAVSRLTGRRAVMNLAPTFSPYHVFGFNPKALSRLVTKHGFTVVKTHVWAHPDIPSNGSAKDRAKAFAAMQLMRVANLTETAGNMEAWCRRV